MRRLMLLRHAKSDWATAGLRDHDRPLNARGREAATKMGAYMVRHALVPDLIVASTAKRVTETLDLLLPPFDAPPKVSEEPRIYEASVKALLHLAKNTPSAVHSLLLVGHNPGFAEFAGLLIASGEAEARQQMVAKFPTAALAVIDFDIDEWGKMTPHSGRLDRFVIPRALEAATD